MPPLAEPPVRIEPQSETHACYGEDWPSAATSTVLVDRKQHLPVPAGLDAIKGLSSYLPVSGGWLATQNRGEWGGGLYFVATDGGGTTEICSGNFHYITQRADGFIAVEGLGHIGINHGEIWRVGREEGQFVAHPWVELPSSSAFANRPTASSWSIPTLVPSPSISVDESRPARADHFPTKPELYCRCCWTIHGWSEPSLLGTRRPLCASESGGWCKI